MDLQQQLASVRNTIHLLEAASRAVDNAEPALVAAVATTIAPRTSIVPEELFAVSVLK